MSGERFVVPRGYRFLLSGVMLVPCLIPLALQVHRPMLDEVREFRGAFGISLGTWPFLVALQGVVLAGLMWLLQTRTMTIVLTESGLTMYRTWRLHWDDVASVRLRTIFGLKYLHVVRSGRMQPSLWVPLYFVGPRPLPDALRSQAPLGSAIRECLGAAATGAPQGSGRSG